MLEVEEEKRPVKKRKIEGNGLTLQSLLLSMPELVTRIAMEEDEESLLNLSYTCKLFHEALFPQPAYWCARLAVICESKPTMVQQKNIETIKELYLKHKQSIHNAGECFFALKKQIFPGNKLNIKTVDENGSLFKNLNNIMLFIASHGYFHLLGKIAAEMDGFYIDKFANQASETPLFIAAKYGYKKTFSLMQSGNWFHATQLENFDPFMDSDPFHNLALFGHTQYLIEVYDGICEAETKFGVIRGSFPELPDACTDVIYGRSFAASYPLMKESYDPDDNTSLIDYVKGEDNLGWSALHWAACLGNLALLKEAASLITDVNTPAKNMTALHFACIKNHPECMKYLLTQGATLVVITEIMYCNHPLQMAAYHGSTEVLQILLSHMQENPAANADINYIDGNNETALHIACRENRSHCVKFLVDAGIDTTLVNEEGKTAETIAQEEKNTECLEILTAQNSLKQLFNENR